MAEPNPELVAWCAARIQYDNAARTVAAAATVIENARSAHGHALAELRKAEDALSEAERRLVLQVRPFVPPPGAAPSPASSTSPPPPPGAPPPEIQQAAADYFANQGLPKAPPKAPAPPPPKAG